MVALVGDNETLQICENIVKYKIKQHIPIKTDLNVHSSNEQR